MPLWLFFLCLAALLPAAPGDPLVGLLVGAVFFGLPLLVIGLLWLATLGDSPNPAENIAARLKQYDAERENARIKAWNAMQAAQDDEFY